MTRVRRRPRRSNQSLSVDRGRKALKTIYYTEARLQKLLRSVIKPDRERWFADRVRELSSWPELTPHEILTAASKIHPQRLMDGRWLWPKSAVKIMREQIEAAPEDGIDKANLRALLAELPDDAAEKLIGLLADSGLLKDSTEPLDSGLPQPRELSIKTLRRIRRADRALRKDLGPDAGDIRRAEIPRANPVSNYERALEFVSDLDNDSE